MARETKTICSRCEARLGAGPYCPKCGYPAPHAAHEDRVEWELRQWGAPNPAAMVASTPMKSLPTVEVETRTRRWFKPRNGNGNGSAVAVKDGNGHHSAEVVQSGNEAKAAAHENGNGCGHAVEPASEVANGNGDGHGQEELSPFAPAPGAGKKASVKRPATKRASEQFKPVSFEPTAAKVASNKGAPMTEADEATRLKPSPAAAKKSPPSKARPRSAPKKAAKPATVATSVQDEPVAAEVTAAPKAKTMRNVHRLPSLADVEAAAKQGPSMVKILRLIQLRAAVLEAQIDAETETKAG